VRLRPIRLPETLESSANVPAPIAQAPAPIRVSVSAEPAPLAPKKISPNGTGVPATERVPASCGPSVPTPLPSPFAPPAPIRIPFKISPPSNDLRGPSSAVTTPALPKAATTEFSHDGPQVRLPLRNVLRGISPFQLTGPVDAVPDSAMVEIPFSIVEPQLALGRIAVAPAQFRAALPEEFRGLFKADETDTPVILPLQEVLQNLPAEKLQLRDDQVEVVLAETFETPFSAKAAEDAARMKVAAGPIVKAVVVAGGVDPGAAGDENIVGRDISLPGSPPPATTATTARTARTALQVAFETDEELDAKAVVAHTCELPGVSACAIVFSDGLSLAGNIPPEYQAEALCALAPSIMKRINDQMVGASLGPLTGITLYCAKTPVSLFSHGNICLAALHAGGEIAPEVRARLGCAVRELARMYAQPA
jgi:predicted regulator of Ras-like GTPase activity (Roadblock/LC7/MglB family)